MSTTKNGYDLARKSSFDAGDPKIRAFIGDRMAKHGLTQIEHLATNECQYPPSPKVIKVLQEAVPGVNLYPDPSSTELRRALAAHYHIKETMVTVGNGADELLYMIGKAFIEEGENAVISCPCYPTEIRGIESMGGHVKRISYRPDFTCDIEATLAAIDAKTKVVMLCTPGNPNTKVITKEELAYFMEKAPKDVLLVMDEAYKEFITLDYACDPMEYFQEDRNIIFLRTFSKFYGLAGLRVGYALGPEHVIEVLRRSIPAFPVNILAQKAAVAALADQEYYAEVFKKIVADREYLTEGLIKAGMNPVTPSQTNFLFVDTCKVPPAVFEQTLFENGVHIRGANYHPYDNHVRITIGTKEQNDKIIATAEKLCKQYC